MVQNETTKLKASTAVSGRVDPLLMPDVTYRGLYAVCGFFLCICTFMLAFATHSAAFFFRENWTRRKALIKWLDNNDLPQYSAVNEFKTWEIDGYQITLIGDCWYMFRERDLVIGSFHCGLFDTLMYRKILKALKA